MTFVAGTVRSQCTDTLLNVRSEVLDVTKAEAQKKGENDWMRNDSNEFHCHVTAAALIPTRFKRWAAIHVPHHNLTPLLGLMWMTLAPSTVNTPADQLNIRGLQIKQQWQKKKMCCSPSVTSERDNLSSRLIVVSLENLGDAEDIRIFCTVG